ncbi:hypothetical protein E1265_18060 [Streptomyces sp. 8K308]|uniref:AraC-like ligand-binding domain-containing protein n=1 Tax=Streptomyces sp. 8K308 TaxID=2530388 RepID=UPI0010483967|nr:hypothetical protein [Streptomyces sp. 8K308]TDC21437.1 hypothetical protein E1265_18060 [Streptomyces sp. 8K308]
MAETVLRTNDLPVADRFPVFCELAKRMHAPMAVSSAYAADFQAEMRAVEMGDVCLWPTVVRATVFDRTPRLVRQFDPETYHLSLILRGTAGAVRGDQEVSCRPYDFHSTSSSIPRAFHAGDRPAGFVAIGFDVPRAAVPLPAARARRAIGERPLSGREGPGGLLADVLLRLAREADSFAPSDELRLAAVLADLVAATLAHSTGSHSYRTPADHRTHPSLRQPFTTRSSGTRRHPETTLGPSARTDSAHGTETGHRIPRQPVTKLRG